MKTATETADAIIKKIHADSLEHEGVTVIDDDAEEFIQTTIEEAIRDAFRAGFEHAVDGGDEAAKQFGIPRSSLPVVLYFDTEKDRREMIDAVQAHFGPRGVTIKIPERKP